MSTKAEQAVSYAALILADSALTITSEKLQALLKAASIEDVEPIWTTLFAKALEGKEIKDIVTDVAASGPGVGAGEEKDGKDDGDAGDGEKDKEDGIEMEGYESDGSAFGDLFA
ncbi:hypothetical protein CC86DRAFT_367546 [Ophiobolus disseminans]|uniref:Large ribosomal subunit protein P1 n=1 Tax=Ophiobolus disseminans TaxID=1469910 RepID=A0A6A7ADZ6_9PLEO|nr:hypothetical protein CC86DRAFT_367546 [Ophiobolus disseminans]